MPSGGGQAEAGETHVWTAIPDRFCLIRTRTGYARQKRSFHYLRRVFTVCYFDYIHGSRLFFPFKFFK